MTLPAPDFARKEFSGSVKKAVRERSGGTCEVHLIPEEMRRVRYPALPTSCNRKAGDIDHIHGAWSNGDTTIGNAAHLCDPCHKVKTVTDNKEAKKTARLRGKTGQTKRRAERKSKWGSQKLKSRNQWPPKGSRKIASRGFGK